MKKVLIISLFLLGLISYSSAQVKEYKAIQKNPMDTIVFMIDTSSPVVKIDTCVFYAYSDRDFDKKGFSIIINGAYYQSTKYENRIKEGFEKIRLDQLLNNTFWYKVENPIIFKTRSKLKYYGLEIHRLDSD